MKGSLLLSKDTPVAFAHTLASDQHILKITSFNKHCSQRILSHSVTWYYAHMHMHEHTCIHTKLCIQTLRVSSSQFGVI